jgi:hypothetical protein
VSTSLCVPASPVLLTATAASVPQITLGHTVRSGEWARACGHRSQWPLPIYLCCVPQSPESLVDLQPGSEGPPKAVPDGSGRVSSRLPGPLCRIDQPCPRGWWGHPTCGPCNCDVSKGFDPDCNKTSGECHCKVTAPTKPSVATLASFLHLLGPGGEEVERGLSAESWGLSPLL